MSYDATLGGGGWTVGAVDPPPEGATVYEPGVAGYPAGAIPVTSSQRAANATVTATLPGVAGKRTYITGFQITGAGATAAGTLGVDVAGVVGGSLTYTLVAVAGANSANQPLIVRFDPPVPASADSTAISIAVGALGAGNLSSSVSAQGFQL